MRKKIKIKSDNLEKIDYLCKKFITNYRYRVIKPVFITWNNKYCVILKKEKT